MISDIENDFVQIGITDLDGVIRGKYMHKTKFEKNIANGFGFCNVIFGWDMHDECIDGLDVSGWHNGYMDYILRVDVSSKRILGLENNMAYFFADYHDMSNAAEKVCPRSILIKILEKASRFELEPIYGVDIEWFNFRKDLFDNDRFNNLEGKTITNGMFGYSLNRLKSNHQYFIDILKFANTAGIPIESLHTETGPGVVETALIKKGALYMADNIVLFKNLVKQIGENHGILPSFMAKWNENLPGCSAHLHHSMSPASSRQFGFREDGNLDRFTEHFLAGQLLLLPELLPFYAPTVNSYKRFRAGSWAPTTVSWGFENRTTAVRLISEENQALRLELRVPGADANPYLSIAASLASGLYGLEHELRLETGAITSNAYTDNTLKKLSPNLKEATDLMFRSEKARSIFGDTFIDHFAKTRYVEWEKFQNAVSGWELERYFEII